MDRHLRKLVGNDPKKFNLSKAIDVMFLYQHRDVPVFPEYMREELKKRATQTVRSKVNLMRAQGEKVTQELVDEILVDALHRDGVALARNEEDAVHLLVGSEAPRIGDVRDVEGKQAKVVRRYLMPDNGVTMLVVLSEPLDPAYSDTLVKEFFSVYDEGLPPPVMSEEDIAKKRAEFAAAEIADATPVTRSEHIAFNGDDLDRTLHEDLLGKPMPRDQTPEEEERTHAELQMAMMLERDPPEDPSRPKGEADLMVEEMLRQEKKRREEHKQHPTQ